MLEILATLGIGTIAGNIAQNVAGNILDRQFCGLTRGINERIAKLDGAANHDVARAVRVAQLEALRKVVEEYQKTFDANLVADWRKRPAHFLPRIEAFIKTGLAECVKEQGSLSLQVTATVARTIEDALKPLPDEDMTARATMFRRLAEDAVLQELRSELAEVPLQEDFLQCFHGQTGGIDGWYDNFRLFLANQVKDNDRFCKILQTNLLLDLKRLGIKLENLVEQIDLVIGRIERELKEVKVIVRRTEEKVDVVQSGVASLQSGVGNLQSGIDNLEQLMRRYLAERAPDVAKQEGVPLATLRAILAEFEIVDGVADLAKAEQVLRQKASEYKELIARLEDLRTLTDSDPIVRQLREQARDAIAAGKFNDAERFLKQAEEHDDDSLDRLEANLKRRQHSKAETLGAKAELARLRFEPLAAAADYLRAVELAADEKTKKWSYTVNAALCFSEHGTQKGVETSLRRAVDLYRSVLALTLPDVPLNWAMTQNNLGTVLHTLGERRGDEGVLEQSVNAYREALKERTQDRVPLDWAATQNNLGDVLRALGQRRGDEAVLEQAESACRAALEERTQERVPTDWALTQNNLGDVLRALGERRGDERLLEQAVEAQRAARLEFERRGHKHGAETAGSNLARSEAAVECLRKK